MKRDELLHAVGYVDENLLAESECLHVRRTAPWVKAALVAAAVMVMSVTALAATKLLSRPVESGGLATEGTLSPVTFVGGDIYREPQRGLKVVMETQVDADAPRYLEQIYRLKPGEGWQEHFRGGGGNGFEYNACETVWTKTGTPGEVRLRQQVVSGYVNGINGKNVVDLLHKLPIDTAVTSRVTELAGRQLLQVSIPAVKLEGFSDQNRMYFRDGETRLYWTDGRYLFRLDYPCWLGDTQAEQLLLTLCAEPYTPDYPDGWGEMDVQKLKAAGYREENGSTSFNISGNATGAAYLNGKFYFGDSGAIRVYDAKTGDTTVMKTWEYSIPRNILLTEKGISFSDSRLPRWGTYHMTADGQTVEPVFEGYQLGDMWTWDNALYGIDSEHNLLRIDLETGEEKTIAEKINKYYMDDAYVYVLPLDGAYFLRAPKKTMEFETVALSFRPISMAVNGADLYFTVGGELEDGQRRYQVVRYSSGEELKLPVFGSRLRIIGGKLLYDADPENSVIEMYDLENGQIDMLQKDVFDYFVFEDRYVVFRYYHDGWGVMDWETGEITHIAELKD